MKRGSEEMLQEPADQVSSSSLTAALSHLNPANSMLMATPPAGRPLRSRNSPPEPHSRFWNQSPGSLQTEWRPLTGNRLVLHPGSHANGTHVYDVIPVSILTVSILSTLLHQQDNRMELGPAHHTRLCAAPALNPHPQNGPVT